MSTKSEKKKEKKEKKQANLDDNRVRTPAKGHELVVVFCALVVLAVVATLFSDRLASALAEGFAHMP